MHRWAMRVAPERLAAKINHQPIAFHHLMLDVRPKIAHPVQIDQWAIFGDMLTGCANRLKVKLPQPNLFPIQTDGIHAVLGQGVQRV